MLQPKQLNQEHLSSTCTVIQCWVEIIASRCRDTKMNSCITVTPRHIIICLIEKQGNVVKQSYWIRWCKCNSVFAHRWHVMHSSYNTSIKNGHLQRKKKRKKVFPAFFLKRETYNQVCFDIRTETSLHKAIVLWWSVFFFFFCLCTFKKYKYGCLFSIYPRSKVKLAFHVLNEMSSIYKAANKPFQNHIVSVYHNFKVAFSKEISINIKKPVMKFSHWVCFHVYLLV